MRKISILSLIAVLSAAPMMAKADPIPTIGLQGDSVGTITANTNVASTSYVQGAYNDLAGHVNTNIEAINLLNAGSSTEGSVDYKINSAITTVNGTAGDLEDLEGDADGATSLVGAINAVDSALGGRLNTLEGDGEGSVAKAEADAKAYADSGTATLTNKTIDASSNTISNLQSGNFASGVIATAIGSVDDASDSKLATERAIAVAINGAAGNAEYTNASMSGVTTVSGAIDNLASRVDSAESAIDVLNGDENTAGSVAKAAADTLSAANAYTDNKRLTVYTTWNSAASDVIALSAATSAAQSGGSQEQSGGSQEEPEEP